MIQKPIKSPSKRLLFFVPIVVLIFMTIDWVFNQLVINTSHSHQGSVFWKTDKDPVKGDFVYFEFQHKLLSQSTESREAKALSKKVKTLSKSNETKLLSKKLVCTEGDNLVVDDNFIICNNKKYPIKHNQETGSGKSIKQFYYEGIVPKDQAIVWGSNLESFDSRYWGFVGYGALRKMVLVF